MAQQLYLQLGCGVGGIYCTTPTPIQQLSTISSSLNSIPPPSKKEAKALYRQAKQIMKAASSSQRQEFRSVWSSIQEALANVASSVIGTLGESFVDGINEDCFIEDGEEWCYE